MFKVKRLQCLLACPEGVLGCANCGSGYPYSDGIHRSRSVGA